MECYRPDSRFHPCNFRIEVLVETKMLFTSWYSNEWEKLVPYTIRFYIQKQHRAGRDFTG